MSNRKITDMVALTAPASDDVLPIVDISEAAAVDKNKKISIEELFKGVPNGTAAAPSIAFESDDDSGIFLAGTNTVGITTAGTQRVTIDGSGNVTIDGDLTVNGATTTIDTTSLIIEDKNIEMGVVSTPTNTTADGGGITLKGATDKTITWVDSTGCWTFNQPTNFNDHVRIDSSGRLLVGTSSSVVDAGKFQVKTQYNGALNQQGVTFLHGAFSPADTFNINLARSRDNFGGDSTVINGTRLGQINFKGYDGTDYESSGAAIYAEVDGNPGSNDMPGRLVAATTADGASSPTERLRIDSSGNVGIGASDPQRPLDVVSNASAETVTFRGASANNISTLRFNSYNASTGYASIQSRPAYFEISTAASIPLLLGTDNTERMRIDSSGNVGIGTTSQSSVEGAGLQVRKYTDRNATYYAPDGHYAGSFGYTNNTQDKVWLSVDSQYGQSSAISAGLFLSSFHQDLGGSGCGSTIKNLRAGNALTFSTVATASSGGSPAVETERMRIDGSGSLGLGTDSPSTLLDVRGEISVAYNANYGIRFYNQDRNNWSSIGNNIASGSTAANMVFKDSTGEVMRLAGGKLLVGTTTSNAAPLTVAGTVGFGDSRFRAVFGDGYVDADSTNTFGAGNSEVQIQTFSANRPAFLSLGGPQGTNEGLGAINFFNSGNTDGKRSRVLILGAQEGSNSDQGGRLGFYTATDGGTTPTERMRIDSSGDVYVSTTASPSGAPRSYFVVKGDNGQGPQVIVQDSRAGTTSGYALIQFFRQSSSIGSITNNGTSVAYNTTSDYRLKENVVDIADGITRVKQLTPKRFNFIVDADKTVDGFLAHEAQTVVPEAVTGTHNEVDADGNAVMQGIDQSKLVPLLTAALQEAIAKIETLETKVAALEAG